MGFVTNRLFFPWIAACLTASCLPAAETPRAPHPHHAPLAPIANDPNDFSDAFGQSTPEAEGVDPRGLIKIAEWVRDQEEPIFSVVVSRHGKLIFELYTSGLGRDEAHYLMSVTKSFTSALVGIAIDQHLLRDENESLADALPENAFATAGDRLRFRPVTIKDVLAMSALDAPVFPHQKDEFARARNKGFVAARNKLIFALSQNILDEPGKSFLYTDVTPVLATGMVELAAHETAFDFAKKNLFDPLGFKNEEWMHEDPAGIDNGAYGLRLRPIDMQKFGVLYLRHGSWNGAQVISDAWVQKSFTPWIRSDGTPHDTLAGPNYGFYWWQQSFAGMTAHVANGWKGQRIAVVPAEDLVVTMTGAMQDGGEEKTFAALMKDFVAPALRSAALAPDAAADAQLHGLLDDVRANTLSIHETLEKRMIPTIAAHDKRHPLAL
jgi:CubicO group peptidase (beta-lactamase class C family)